MMSVRILVVCAALVCLAPSLVGQEDRQGRDPRKAKDAFICPMHPQIRMPEKGRCPICTMDLVQEAPTPEKIRIPPGGLRVYCKNYVEKALEERQCAGAAAFDIVSAHVALRGKDSRKRLRGLLKVAEYDWPPVAASHLGRLQDRESVPLLKKLLADEKFAVRPNYYCSEHPEVLAHAPGKCRKCEKPLVRTGANLWQRRCIAGALHEMGVAEGLRALEGMAKESFGYRAFHSIALRDSPRVREILAAAAKAEAEPRRSCAISAQLRLGLKVNLSQVLRLLRNGGPEARNAVIVGLGDSGMKPAIEPLMEIVRDKGLPWCNRVSAAEALVKLGEKKYLGFLMDAFQKMAGTNDRFLVYCALGEVGDTSVLPLLATAIENDAGYRAIAVAAAAKILGREGTKASKK